MSFELEIDQAPKIAFRGRLKAEVSSQKKRGRWTTLALYRTESGRYVCHTIGRTQRPGEHDRYSGQVCETEADVIAFFGQRWLAKKLYDQAGIRNVLEVE